MIDAVIENLDRFQTAIVGILGFLGVIYTIKKNAELARQQHQRELGHERTLLRTALCAELEEIRRMYQDRIKTLQEDLREHQSALMPEYVPNTIYQQLLARIGLLTPEEVNKLITAYALVAELPSRLRLLPADVTSIEPERPGYVRISSSQAQNAATMHKNFLECIDHALEKVRSNLKLAETKDA